MTQRIQLGAILQRDGKLLLVRTQIGAPWELPGTPFGEDAEDMDATMAAALYTFGVSAANIEEDFFETVFLGEPQDRLVYNLYAPVEWGGEPVAPAHSAGIGWFAVEALADIEMDVPIRDAVLQAFGLQDRPDTDTAIAEALRAATSGDPGTLPASSVAVSPPAEMPLAPEPPAAVDPGQAPSTPNTPVGDDRIARGRDVLGTLSAGDANAESNLRSRIPELADDVLGALGDTWARPIIDRKTRSLQVVAMLSALGKTGPLRTHLAGALNHGASPAEIIETLRTVAVYAGFPAALEAWTTMEEVFAARGIERPGGAV